MKYPRMSNVVKANRQLKKTADVLHHRILVVALSQYATLSGDQRGLGLLRSRSYPELLSWAGSLVAVVHPTANVQFAASQVSALIRKYPWNPKQVATDPEATAVKTFMAAERRCARMNRKFRLLDRPHRRKTGELDYYLSRMRSWIRYVLGDGPNLDAIYRQADITGGASLGVHGDATNLLRKLMAEAWTVTPTCLPYLASVMSHNFHFATRVAKGNGVIQSLHVLPEDVLRIARLVSSNKVAFVPKTAETYRSIAVEPLGNGIVQKGTDLEMRKHLKRVGIDLSDQTRNQRLAYYGSILGSEGWATIDLKSASDSNFVELNRNLLPPDWFNFLNRIRSPSYSYLGLEIRSEKFCTMGNGFCFPLETLIFAAACHAITGGNAGRDFSVYGDDIIVPVKHSEAVIRLLREIGFKTNSRKTFVDGPFRESCGSNWYSGEDVTPFTLDFRLDSLQSLYKFINLARRNSRSSSFLEDCIHLCLSAIPDRLLLWRPYKGDPETGIDPAGLEFTPRYWSRCKSLQTHRWCELESHPVKDEMMAPDWVVMAAALRGHPEEQLFTYRRKVVWRVRVIARSGDLTPSEPSFGTLRIEARARWLARFIGPAR